MRRASASIAPVYALACALVCAPVGCLPNGGAPDDGDAGDGALIVELGTGERSFEPIADGEALPLVAGSQGGHHVWVSVRVRGAAPDGLAMLFVQTELVDLEGGALGGQGRVMLVPSAAGGGWLEYAGWPAQLSRPECAAGVDLMLRATVEDAAGKRGRDVRTVTVRAEDVPGGGCTPEP